MEKKISKDLLKIIYEVQSGSKSAMEKTLEIFEPLISKYAFWLKDEDARQNFCLFIIEQFKSYPVTSFHSDAAFVQYISRSVCHEYIRLSKYQQNQDTKLQPLTEKIENSLTCDTKAEDRMILSDLLSRLPIRQKEILILKYYYGYIDQEIADSLCISRQAINKQRNKALKKLRIFMES